MRILLDLTSLAGNYSGIEQYAHHIAEALVRVNKKHQLLYLFQGEVFSELREVSESPHVTPIVFKPKRKNKLAVSQLDVARALGQARADAYILPAFPQPLAFKNPHCVNVIHDVSFWDCPHTFTKKSMMYWRASTRHAAKNKLLVTVSEFSRSRISAVTGMPVEQIHVAYDGIDSSFLRGRELLDRTERDEILHRYGLPQRFILSLCTLEPRKNLPFLIQAWTMAVENDEDVADLVLAGRKGWKTDDLLSDVPHHLLSRIHLTGFVESEDLPRLYNMSERFVYPSIYEGFGLPPLEALVAGASVLCSDIEVFHETCSDLVSFFPLDDPSALSQLLTAPAQKASMSTAESVCHRFNWEDSAERILWCATHCN